MKEKIYKLDGTTLRVDVETAEEMIEAGEVSRELTDQSRWETYEDIVVKHNDKHYVTSKSHGSTEIQEGRSNWDYATEVVWHEVEKRQVMTEQWVRI